MQIVECDGRGLLDVQVAAGVLCRDIRNAHADLDLLAIPQVVEREPVAHVVARELAAVLGIKFILAVVGGPLGLDARHGALLLPIARPGGGFGDTQDEIDGKNLLGIVAERAEELGALDFGGADAPHRGAALVGETLAEI